MTALYWFAMVVVLALILLVILGQGLANATTQKMNASIAALEQVAGSLGLDLEKFVKRVAGQDDKAPDVKRVKGTQ